LNDSNLRRGHRDEAGAFADSTFVAGDDFPFLGMIHDQQVDPAAMISVNFE
jgi:hypothetical protein